jgi:hypothetical protein
MWSCTRCGHGVRRTVSADMSDQGRFDVTCARAQGGVCEARRLKWSQRQSIALGGAPGVPQGGGGEQVSSPGAHIPNTVLGKRAGTGRTPRQANHAEDTSGAGPHDNGGADHLPTTGVRSDPRSTRQEERTASHCEGRASEAHMDLDEMTGDPVGANPLNQVSPSAATDTKCKKAGSVGEDSKQPHEGGSNETSEREGKHPPRQLSPRGAVPASREEVNETLTTAGHSHCRGTNRTGSHGTTRQQRPKQGSRRCLEPKESAEIFSKLGSKGSSECRRRSSASHADCGLPECPRTPSRVSSPATRGVYACGS